MVDVDIKRKLHNLSNALEQILLLGGLHLKIVSIDTFIRFAAATCQVNW